MTIEKAKELINIYAEAWETKNPNLVATIFTENATYLDPKEPENFGIAAIKAYWKHKVVEEQDKIKFELLNIWTTEEVVIAEWHATFLDIKRKVHIDMREVGIFSVKNDKFSSLREYYKSVKTPF